MTKYSIFSLIIKLQHCREIQFNGSVITIQDCYFNENSIDVFVVTKTEELCIIKRGNMEGILAIDGVTVFVDYTDLQNLKGVDHALLARCEYNRVKIYKKMDYLNSMIGIKTEHLPPQLNGDIFVLCSTSLELDEEFKTQFRNIQQKELLEVVQEKLTEYSEMLTSIKYAATRIKYCCLLKQEKRNEIVPINDTFIKIEYKNGTATIC